MEKRARWLHILLFMLYSAVMLWLLFDRSGAVEGLGYWEQVRQSYSLKPFRTILLYWNLLGSSRKILARLAVINLFGNIIMFVPLGFFLPTIWKKLRKLWRTLLATALMISAIELAQLFTLLGTCDVDDLILNLAGATIGYIIFRLLHEK